MGSTVFAWTATVDDLIAARCVVRHRCRCPSRDMPLHEIRNRLGPKFSFWNRHPLCPVCGERAYFAACPVKNLFWPVQMRDGPPGVVAAIHSAWREAGLPGRKALPLP